MREKYERMRDGRQGEGESTRGDKRRVRQEERRSPKAKETTKSEVGKKGRRKMPVSGQRERL